MIYDFDGLNLQLAGSARELLPKWFPNGRFVGHEFHMGSIHGEAGNSFKYSLRNQAWKDFANDGEKGGKGLIDLYARSRDLTPAQAYLELGGRRVGNGAAPAPAPATPPPPAGNYRLATWDEFKGAQFIHARHGAPTLVTPYQVLDNGQWRIAAVVARYEPTGNPKEIIPYTWTKNGWRAKAPPQPWPVYGQKRLDDNPNAVALIVEGEKCATAAEQVWVTSPIVCWMQGAQNALKANWEPLRGRRVILWPDADRVGERAMWDVGERLIGLGCTVQYISGLTGRSGGWDVVDAIAEMGPDGVKQWVNDNVRDFPPPKMVHADAASEITAITTGPPPLEQPARGVLRGTSESTVGDLWREWSLQVGPNGPYANLSNVDKALDAIAEHGYHALPYYDSFKNRLLYRHEAPGGKILVNSWNETQDTTLTAWMQRMAGLHKFPRSVVVDAVRAYAVRHAIDSYADWLRSLAWDGIERLPMLFTDGFGCEVTPYAQDVGRCFMVGMAARGLSPGCQVDNVVVLEGPQGAGKSSGLRIIGGEYFAEVHTEIGTHRWQEVVQGIALAELSEMQSFSTARNEMIKAAITNCVDRYRPAYGRDVEDRPRRCVFVATTNLEQWLTDPTGGRRYWPIACGKIDRAWLRSVRDQLFAEAVARYQRGESWWDVGDDDATEAQRARHVGDDWDEAVATALLDKDRTTLVELARYTITMELRDIDQNTSRRLAAIMRRFGWRTSASRGVRYWVPGQSVKDWRKRHPGEPRAGAVVRAGAVPAS